MNGISPINTNEVDYHEVCLTLSDGSTVYRWVPECEGCAEVYYTDELYNKIEEPDLTDATLCSPLEKEVVCVDIGDGCNTPAFRITQNGVVSFITSSGDITSQVVNWEAGDCPNEKVYIDTCFLPDQYAIQWSWSGGADLVSYDASTDTATYYGKTQYNGSNVGGFALAFKNDTVEPTLFFQVGGQLYKASPDDPIGTFTLVGSTAPATSSYPCFDFDPSGRLLIGDGNQAWELDPDTGAGTYLGRLIDVRDGANLSVAPGDWFFDPNGQWFMMARDNRGASFINPSDGLPYCTGTALWKIDPSTLEATRVSPSCAPTSGTGASWLAAGQYLLSTSSGIVYNYNSFTDTWDVFYNADDSGTNVGINDLAPQWIIPDPIPIFGWIEPGCPDPLTCDYTLYTLVQDEDSFVISCQEFVPTLAGQIGVCEKEGNPFVSDPFEPGGFEGCTSCPDEEWNEGCSDAGYTRWRRHFDDAGNELISYVYGTLTSPTTVAPPNFNYIPCGEVTPGTENITTFCDLDTNNTVYRKETTLTDGTVEIVWFDADNPNIDPAPSNVVTGPCDTNDPLLPVTEQVICLDGESYVRVRRETNVVNADGLPELTSYQILYFNQNGTLYDSGVLTPADDPVGEPTGWYLGECVNPYVEIVNEKLCEKDARFLLLIDSGGVFARYSFLTQSWEQVNTLSVASAGGSADVENFLLYNFVAPDQVTVIDVNTDTQLPNLTVTDGVIKPGQTANPKTFSAAAFRDSNGLLYAWDTGGGDAGLYAVNTNTGVIDFVTTISGVAGAGTSIAIDNTTDTLVINGSAGRVYQVDWVTGVGTQIATAPIAANGSTFDTDGNLYVTSGTDTYVLPAGVDGTDPDNWSQIIDDFGAGANSLAYYETVAPKPSCFHRRYGILSDGSRELIGDFFLGTDTPRSIVGDVDCCECGCSDSGSGGGTASDVSVNNFPSNQDVTVTNPVDLEIPTTSTFDSDAYVQGGLQGSDPQYTQDIEAHPVAFPAEYVPPVYVQNKTQVNYYRGNGVNSGDTGEFAEIGAKVWFPESAVVKVEEQNQQPTELDLPTVTIQDYAANEQQGGEDNNYTKDVEAMPVATEQDSYLNVQHRVYEQEYYQGGGTNGFSDVSMKVALPSSMVMKTEEQVEQKTAQFFNGTQTTNLNIPAGAMNVRVIVRAGEITVNGGTYDSCNPFIAEPLSHGGCQITYPAISIVAGTDSEFTYSYTAL